MAKKVKWLLVLVLLGTPIFGITLYQVYEEEIALAEHAFNTSETLKQKYGESEFRLMNRIRGYGGKSEWDIYLEFISFHGGKVIKLWARFSKKQGKEYELVDIGYRKKGAYISLTGAG
ncbi:MAG: hypothetical protein ABW092_19255 [Candidatus Thiodiazotropha sp.]